MNENDTTPNAMPRSWTFRVAYFCLSNEMKIFWLSVLLGVGLASTTIFFGGINNAKNWRAVFITYPMLFAFSIVSLEIVVTRMLHLLAGSKSRPIRLDDLKNWKRLNFADRVQVNFSLLAVFVGCSTIGWILGALVFLFWSK